MAEQIIARNILTGYDLNSNRANKSCQHPRILHFVLQSERHTKIMYTRYHVENEHLNQKIVLQFYPLSLNGTKHDR